MIVLRVALLPAILFVPAAHVASRGVTPADLIEVGKAATVSEVDCKTPDDICN